MLFFFYISLQFWLFFTAAANYGYGYSRNCASKRVVQARVFMFKATDHPNASPVQPIGVVDIAEDAYGFTTLNGTISGLAPGAHGFHFHQFGDISKACMGAGAHFNPYNVNHGAQNAHVRHVGDLGNLIANGNGVAVVNIHDRLVKLNGWCSVVGRALVVHEKKDDFGLGGDSESLKTGNSGKRVGCGVVGITKEQ